jgi:hypothetical protein
MPLKFLLSTSSKSASACPSQLVPPSDRMKPSPRSDRSATDVFDELDQFVDSEPVGWGNTRRQKSSPGRPDKPQAAATPPGDAPNEAPSDDAGGDGREDHSAAFSRRPQSGRREAFAARLNAELERPPNCRTRWSHKGRSCPIPKRVTG